MLVNHNLVETNFKEIIFEKRPAKDKTGNPIEGLFNAWILLNNPGQYNSYTTNAVKEVILAMRQASNDRSVVAIVFTGVGNQAFCTGGNTKEYAEYYSGNPQEYKQYMRLFNDMVSSILMNDKPVICRVNGMRIGGGQEIGMACDFSISQDLARFGQAGPKHGSAPIGGSTDFLPLYVGIENAMYSCTVCDPWSAHEAYRMGLLTEVVPALKVDGKYVANPLVVVDKWVDAQGRIVYGRSKTGEDLAKGKELMKSGVVDLTALDEAVEKCCTKLLYTMPNCLSKTINTLRVHKLVFWDMNKESHRDWLALNMATEGKAGFRAFNDGPKDNREVNFIKIRQLLAQGHEWNDELIEVTSPNYQKVQ
ncbi:MAG: 6-oxocyclohex-1-ene-1-carbonyl-CoA hydratase [Bacteroidetes bacterium CG_4_10_14_3_um_filter_31_20]|nr:6-oxocyclohex-1-ene-1-carbonyl-CoA hydratase [Bacteroidota bacterium]PIX36171.1 MAG: 6-oxocyclohex-1-ene-1-carbonyl-CoA hydratase [Bacteroidetes bacterium CG_4_8_14_3_um_filter_31_14]PIY07471.1 MAG: 6-oxocyclohex-1-ene-1-carbonyl-CoA hydratase [Bacteroidetes bacterium CG_4_10_14_3_um_filter_31_20]